jgi:hypothetical protein
LIFWLFENSQKVWISLLIGSSLTCFTRICSEQSPPILDNQNEGTFEMGVRKCKRKILISSDEAVIYCGDAAAHGLCTNRYEVAAIG